MVVCAHSFYFFWSLFVFWSPKSTTDVSNYILTCIRRVLLCVLNIFLRVPHQYCCVCASSQLRVQLDNKWRRRRMPLISKPRLKRNSSVTSRSAVGRHERSAVAHWTCPRVFFFLSLVENKIDGRKEKKKNLVSKMAAILFGDTKRLSMKREAPDKKKITKQTNTYSKDIFFFLLFGKIEERLAWPLPAAAVSCSGRATFSKMNGDWYQNV